MAKKQAAKKAPAKTTKKAAKTSKKTAKKPQEEQIVLSTAQDKALKLVDKSATVRDELEEAVTLAATKVVQKCMKGHGIDLTGPEASLLTSIWFED